jgi:hypothetical protein
MTTSPAQNQRAIDEDGDIETRSWVIKDEAAEILSDLGTYEYPEITKFGTLDQDWMGEAEVMEAVADLAWDEIKLAFSHLDSDPLEAVRILKEARDTGVSHVLSLIDFESVARAERELNRRNVV